MRPWPELRIETWRDTYATLHLYTQIIGKIRLGLTPTMNEWWNAPLYVTTRGLTTSPMPYQDRTISIDFDFIEHQLVLRDSDGRLRSLALVPRPVCDFYAEVIDALGALDARIGLNVTPQECPVTTPLSEDKEHMAYDRDQAYRFHQVLCHVEPVFQKFRAGFRGKCSPVHFFWGAFDLAVSRFSGRRAPPRRGLIERIAYDEEVCSLGFWPGDPWTGKTDALFYSYTVPEPAGYARQRFRPDGAFFSPDLRECVLPYETVRRSLDPERTILEFAESTYDTGASLAKWDLAALAFP
jgi:hypothetical protein